MLEGATKYLADTSMSLFAIMDGARDRAIRKKLESSTFPYQSLYEGDMGASLAPFGPYLVELPRDGSALQSWLHDGWGQSYGVFLMSEAQFPDIRRHLRRFLTVELEGRNVYFRFYDPRVLRQFLPQCTYEEWVQFFGPIESFWVESEDARSLLRFRRDADDPEPERLALTSSPNPRFPPLD